MSSGFFEAASAMDQEPRFTPMDVATLDTVCAIENQVYPHPWKRVHFADALAAGYRAVVLRLGEDMVGYYVAMQGADEVHLLNIAVAAAHQRHGWAPVLLGAVDAWARELHVAWVWLEVRVSNARAIAVYERHGYRPVGVRKGYYPLGPGGGREDALIMSLRLTD